MRKFKVLQTLVEQLRKKDEWADWDMVLEYEQRADDNAPRIRAAYWSWIEVDWGDGNGTQRIATVNNASGIITGPALSPGVYTMKIRLNPDAGSSSRFLRFGPDVTDNTSQMQVGNTYLPQLKRVLKADMKKLNGMSYMFCKCARLVSVPKFINTQKLGYLKSTFQGCINLEGTVAFDDLKNNTAADLAFWNTPKLEKILLGPMPKCTTINNMCNRSGIREIDISDLGNCTYAGTAFYLTTRLKKVIIPGGLPKVTAINSMFGYSNVEEVDIGTYFPECVNAANCFMRCLDLRDVHGFGRFVKLQNASGIMQSCAKLTRIELDLGSVCSSLVSAFYGCDNLTELIINGTFNNLTSMAAMCYSNDMLSQITINGEANKLPDMPSLTTLTQAFVHTSLPSFEIGDLPALTNMQSIFDGDDEIESFVCGDIGGWNEELQQSAAGAGTATAAFYNAVKLKYFKCGNHNLATIQTMFYNCAKLEEAIFGDRGYRAQNGHDYDGIANAANAFTVCTSLKHVRGDLRLRRVGPSSATYFNGIFDTCLKLLEMPNIWPEDGFAETFVATGSIQLTTVFQTCYNMQGHAPSWLWDPDDPRRYKGAGSKNACFSYCYFLDNYADIPITWKLYAL